MQTITKISSMHKPKSSSLVSPIRISSFFAPLIQPKLMVNQPNDIYEQEADAAANKVMRMPVNKNEPFFFKPANTLLLQRKCSHCEEKEKLQMQNESNVSTGMGATSIVHDVINSSGQPLDGDTKNFMESGFGYDFGNVRIHNDSLAHNSSSQINALAYTHGNHIAFGAGQYQPGTEQGKQLISHELAHVALHQHTNLIARQKAPATASTPMPRGAVAQKTGGFTVQIGYITITVMPDVINSAREKPHEAHTYMDITRFTIPEPQYDTDPQSGLVSKFTPYPTLQVGLTVETNYGSKINLSGPADYGYGTRPGDKKNKTNTIRFHEGSHGSEFINYIRTLASCYKSNRFN